jgi:hypothetical protein
MMEAVHTSETSVDNYFTRQYIPEDNSEHQTFFSLKINVMPCQVRGKGGELFVKKWYNCLLNSTHQLIRGVATSL